MSENNSNTAFNFIQIGHNIVFIFWIMSLSGNIKELKEQVKNLEANKACVVQVKGEK